MTQIARGLLFRGWVAAVLLSLGLVPAPAGGQLRPLSPFAWEVFDSTRTTSARLGLGVLLHQRASLAGTEGRLLEIGDFGVTWRSDRIALEAGGTLLRVFDDRDVFSSPYGGARVQETARRRDSGDYRISTVLLLTPPERPAVAMVRFGTRLPTTDNRVGLERDRTDFYALFGGQFRRGDLRLTGETGVGIHGTRDSEYEQSDVLLYALSAAYRKEWFSPVVTVVGQMDGRLGVATRGNEELAELRLGARLGRRFWVEVQAVRGLLTFSPRTGLLLATGLNR